MFDACSSAVGEEHPLDRRQRVIDRVAEAEAVLADPQSTKEDKRAARADKAAAEQEAVEEAAEKADEAAAKATELLEQAADFGGVFGDKAEQLAGKAGQLQAGAEMIGADSVAKAAEKAGEAVGEVGEMAAGAGEALGDAAAIVQSAEVQGIKDKMLDLVTAPVAGPFAFRILYFICVLGVFVYFFYLIIDAAATTWTEPVTELDQVFELELEYPDIYTCVPPTYAGAYNKGNSGHSCTAIDSTAGTDCSFTPGDESTCGTGCQYKRNNYYVNAANRGAVIADAGCGLTARATFSKIDPLSGKLFGDDAGRLAYAPDEAGASCPAIGPSAGAP